NLGEEFKNWVTEACIFGSTLVDRIVTGYPRDEAESIWDELGYRDNLLDTGELFALWVIESEKEFKDLNLNETDIVGYLDWVIIAPYGMIDKIVKKDIT
ncbi:MAG: hypothetical protein J6K69_01485, partial [Candidatus Methanomethylophilaceae archaeon]|nr:hypothetical protein [Candidatus Methanomethylophilaceae archaeon]